MKENIAKYEKILVDIKDMFIRIFLTVDRIFLQ